MEDFIQKTIDSLKYLGKESKKGVLTKPHIYLSTRRYLCKERYPGMVDYFDERIKEAAKLAILNKENKMHIPEIRKDDRIDSVERVPSGAVYMVASASYLRERGITIGSEVNIFREVSKECGFYTVKGMKRLHFGKYRLKLHRVVELTKKESPATFDTPGVDGELMAEVDKKRLAHLEYLINVDLATFLRNNFCDFDELLNKRISVGREDKIIFSAIEYLNRIRKHKLTRADCKTLIGPSKYTGKITPRKIGKRDTRKVMIENDEDYFHNF